MNDQIGIQQNPTPEPIRPPAERMVYVTNNTVDDLNDAFNGKEYSFPAGQTVSIPEVAAIHIFGYGQEDRTPQIARFGWAYTKNDLPHAILKLDKFIITRHSPKKKAA